MSYQTFGDVKLILLYLYLSSKGDSVHLFTLSNQLPLQLNINMLCISSQARKANDMDLSVLHFEIN